MALIELQIREQRFIDLFIATVNRKPLPFPSLDIPILPEIKGLPLERIECVGAVVEAGSETELRVRAEVDIHYHPADLADVKAAGSLKKPPAKTLRRTVDFTASVAIAGGRPALHWTVAMGLIPVDSMGMDLPEGLRAVAGAIVPGDGVVAVRIATSAADSLNEPVRSRVGAHDWAQLVSGPVLADILVRNFQESVDGLVSDELQQSRAVSGSWNDGGGFGPFAFASGELTKINACLGRDVAITLNLRATFTTSGAKLITTLDLSWDGEASFCEMLGLAIGGPVGFALVEAIVDDEVAMEVLGKGVSSTGFEEIARTDLSITYQRVSLPSTPSLDFVLVESQTDEKGLVERGSLRIQAPRRGLEGEAYPPYSGYETDCNRRSVEPTFYPAQVALRDIGVDGGVPKLFGALTEFEPKDAWAAVVVKGNTWLDLSIAFVDHPKKGRQPVGTPTSVVLHTDCGVRWVDLGVVPEQKPPPSVGQIAEMVSQCMAIRDPWGMGVLNLDWLVDPPPVERDDLVRQWTIGFKELPAGVSIALIAKRAGGQERQLGLVQAIGDSSLLVATDADETLVIRPDQALSAPAPLVMQRWLFPYASVALDTEPAAIASTGGVLALRDAGGGAHIVDVAAGNPALMGLDAAAESVPAYHAALAALDREERRGGSDISTVAPIDTGTVAVVHQGSLHFATAGIAQMLQ